MLHQSKTFESERILKFAGHLLFLTLLTYSIVYAVERVTYVDSAIQFFIRVNYEGFCTPADRYGVVISEIPLFIATKLGLPFEVLVYVFSASYIVLYYGVWAICVNSLKNSAAGLAIVLTCLLGIREGFIHPVTETHQCLIYSVLLFAVLGYNWRRESLKWVSVVFVSLLISFTHPIGVFTGGFAAALSVIITRQYRAVPAYLSVALLVSIAVWKFIFPTDDYDAALYTNLKHSATQGSGLTSSGPLGYVMLHFFRFYWLPVLLGIVALLMLAVRKRWLELALFIGGISSYMVAAMLTFTNWDSSILMERSILPACFMIALVFSSVFTSVRIRPVLVVLIILFVFINGIRFINNGCLMYKKRVAYLDEIVQIALAQGNDKYSLSEELTDRDKILIPWALGAETLIYSKFTYNKCVSISMKDEVCNPTDVRISNMECLPITKFNAKYFQLSDKPYSELK